jgi:hypothetical protein
MVAATTIMADAEFKGGSPNSQFLAGELPHAQTRSSWWEGTGASIVIHVLVLGVLIYSATHARDIVNTVTAAVRKIRNRRKRQRSWPPSRHRFPSRWPSLSTSRRRR